MKIVYCFYAGWCGPCKLLHNDLDKPECQELLAKYKYIMYIDIDLPAMEKHVKYYNVTSIPLMVVIDDKGNELARLNNYNELAVTMKFLKDNA